MEQSENREPNESSGAIKEIPAEEMVSALYGSFKKGVGMVTGSVGAFARYSWMGAQFAGGDLKQLSSKALVTAKSRFNSERAVEHETA